MRALLMLALLLSGGAKPEKPGLALRAFPLNAIGDAGTGTALITITAELRGPETEEYYCPDVDITWPDTTTSGNTGDCPPFTEREQCYGPEPHDPGCDPFGYPRRWTWRARMSGEWSVTVELSKSGRILKNGRQTVSGMVR